MTDVVTHKLVYGVSRWTNSTRAAARHINKGDGTPLCGGRKGSRQSWLPDYPEVGEPSCKSCIAIYRRKDKQHDTQ